MIHHFVYTISFCWPILWLLLLWMHAWIAVRRQQPNAVVDTLIIRLRADLMKIMPFFKYPAHFQREATQTKKG